MDDFLAARWQMALSLGFHIIFSCIGIAMPFLMAVAHFRWLKTGEPAYKTLTKAWMRGVAIFFAVGAVSGTALSFELGLLWPGFMEHAGGIIGMPFSWEGTAFFIEAIALGLYLYGWERLRPWVHWGCGVVVGISGVLSGLFVICANAWMNAPAGFDWVDGKAINVDPYAAMFNDAALSQGLHMTLAAFVATGFAVAGMHALLLLKRPKHPVHSRALRIALGFAAIFALAMPISGHHSAQDVARRQPTKLAAMESLFETQQGAPLLIGGWPDVETRSVRWGIELPKMLSFLVHNDFETEVEGLDATPEDLWPPVPIVHLAFQIMVGIGSTLAGVGLLGLLALIWKQAWLERRWLLKLLVACTPLGFIAVEAGWTVTEVGRQPWIIYGVMHTRDALSPLPGLAWSLALYATVYLFLSAVVLWLMVRQVRALHQQLGEEGT